MDSKGIKKLHKRVEELHTLSLVARYHSRLETQCAIPPLVCVIFLFLSNPWCNYLLQHLSRWADDLSHWEDSNFAGSCSLKKDNLMKLMNAKCLYSPPIPFEDDEKKWYAQRTDLFHTLPPLLPLLLKKVNFLKVTNDVRIGSLIGVIQQDFA